MPVSFLQSLWEGMSENSRQNVFEKWNYIYGEIPDYILKWKYSPECKGTCGVILCKGCMGDLENVLDF